MDDRYIFFQKTKYNSNELLTNISRYIKYKGIITTYQQMHQLDKEIDEFLEYDDEGNLIRFYNHIKNQLDITRKLLFFKNGILKDVTIKNFIITNNMYINVFRYISLEHVSLENVTFAVPLEDLKDSHFNLHKKIDNIKNISMPQITSLDWDKTFDVFEKKGICRILGSPFTFKTNIYLELGRNCNGKCKFCRNACLDDKEYNINEIEYSLDLLNIRNHRIDSVVIGGGEPTLLKEALDRIIKNSNHNELNTYIFSNGSANKNLYKHYIDNKCKIYLSRHSINKNVNSDIIGISKNQILTLDELSELNNFNPSNISLSCTCINGGVDTVDEIIKYINIAYNVYNFHNIIFSNLQSDASIDIKDSRYDSMLIDDKIFTEVIELLKMQGFECKYPIVSTGGYEMYVLKHNHISIVFKKYLSKKELELKWLKAVKRTFDLSIDPSGNVYTNWSETGKQIVLK